MKNDISKYLKSSPLCDFDSETIRHKADAIVAGAKSQREKSNRILEFWKNEIVFTYDNWDVPASAALSKGSGMCAAKNAGSVAMHRYAGIPARLKVLGFDAESKLWEYAARWDPWLAGKTKTLGKRRDHVIHEIYLDGRWEQHDVTRDNTLEAGMKIYGMPSEADFVPEDLKMADFDRWAVARQKKAHIPPSERAEFHRRINNIVRIIRETGMLVLDKESGASQLARKAVATLKEAIERDDSQDIAGFLRFITEAGGKLTEARPNMAPLTNLMATVFYQVQAKARTEKDLPKLRQASTAIADKTIKDSKKAGRQAAKNGADLIANGNKIMACSFSSTLNELFRLARKQGKEFEVVVSRSRVGDKDYGEMTTKALRRYQIPSKIIPDNAVRHNLRTLGVQKVLVGADSILADGSLVNGWPTDWLALMARDSNIPLYVICETAKFNPRLTAEKVELEAGFDLIPPELITGIVTEEGIIKPGDVGQ
ncbi:MAG: transglutaminase domain-containing protein [Chloroflexota bacterium]